MIISFSASVTGINTLLSKKFAWKINDLSTENLLDPVLNYDGKPSICTVYFEKSELNTARHVSSAMIDYIKNTTICRKDFLFHDFDQVTCKDTKCTPCTCCDICK